MNPREALVALNLIKDVGPITVRHLMDHFGSAPAILRAPVRELLQVDRVGPETAQTIVRWEQTVDLAGELKRIRDFDCHIIANEDAEYPPLLREIYDPPVILYVRGELTGRVGFLLLGWLAVGGMPKTFSTAVSRSQVHFGKVLCDLCD